MVLGCLWAAVAATALRVPAVGRASIRTIRQRWRHSAVALRPTSDARNRRLPADTVRDAVQSAHRHTPRAVCQHRRAADGGQAMNHRFCSLQSGQACACNVRPTRGRRMRPHAVRAAPPLPGTDRRQEVQMPRFIPFSFSRSPSSVRLSAQPVEPIRGDGRWRSSMPHASISSCDMGRVMMETGTTGYSSHVWVDL